MDKDSIIKKSLVGGGVILILTFIQYFIVFLMQVVFARMLAPDVFGVFAYCTMIAFFFHNLINTFGDKYIIKEKQFSLDKVNTVITLELILASILFIAMTIIIPVALMAVGKSNLIEYTQVLCLSFFYIPLSKFKVIYERELSFGKAHIPNLIANAIGGAVGVSLVMNDCGVWGLIAWRLSSMIIEVIILWYISSFSFSLKMDKVVLKEVFKFGRPLILSSILVFIYGNFDYYIVDFLLDETQLGYYWLAFQTSHYFLNLRTGINKVIFPTFSRFCNEEDKFKAFHIATNIVSVLYLLLTIIILIFGKDIVLFVFGPEWAPSITVFKIFFIIVFIKATASNVGPLLHSEGITNADLKLSIVNLIMIIPSIYLGCAYFGIEGASIGVFITSVVSVVIAYKFYIQPITGNGVLYYFGRIGIVCSLLLGILFLFDGGFIIKLLMTFMLFLLSFLLYKKDIFLLIDNVNKSLLRR